MAETVAAPIYAVVDALRLLADRKKRAIKVNQEADAKVDDTYSLRERRFVWEFSFSVPHLTTVGSPPGIQAIRDQLLPLSFPAHVRTWYNAHDPRDVVALYPLNNDNFPVSLAVDNYQGVRNQTDEI
jgi:hypothetical protein